MTTSTASEHFTESLLQLIRQQRHLASRVIIATQEPTISTRLIDLCTFTIVHRFSSPSWFETLRGHVAGLSSFSVEDTRNEHHNETPAAQTEKTTVPTVNSINDAFRNASLSTTPSPSANATDAATKNTSKTADAQTEKSYLRAVFADIIRLQAGEAMLFAPTALADVRVLAGISADGGAGGSVDGGRTCVGGGDDVRVEQQTFGSGIVRMRTRMRLSKDGGRSKMAV